MKKGILVVSFGTTYPETEKKTIGAIERTLGDIYGDYDVRRAYTSELVIAKLNKRGAIIPTPREAVDQMAREGFTHVALQPLLLLKGHEYEKKILEPLNSYLEGELSDCFDGFEIGEPLLSGPDDLDIAAELIRSLVDEEDGHGLILMGHGTDHSCDTVYDELQTRLDTLEIPAHIATVEGSMTLEDLIPRLKEKGILEVSLHPLMLVSGDHANNDMAGVEEDSWVNVLAGEGIKCEPVLKGLGEYMIFRRWAATHLRACLRRLFPGTHAAMWERVPSRLSGKPREEIPWHPCVDWGNCTGCGNCYVFCPKGVYTFDDVRGKVFVNNPYACVVNCARCSVLCPSGAIGFPVKIGVP